MNTIELLPPKEFKVLKVIQIEGHEWNWFTGYLPYLRTFNPKKYNSIKGDVIDEKLFSVIQQAFPKSFLRYNVNILFKNQLKEFIENIEGGSRKNITVQFFPLIPYQNVHTLVGKEFTAYALNFGLRLLFNKSEMKKHHINDFFLCDIPYNIIDEKIKTIQTI